MLSTQFRRTKIIATIGPATDNYQAIKELVAAGANCLRLNMSHDVHEAHARRIAWARRVQKELKVPVAVLVDLQGPKIRVGDLPAEGIELVTGKTVQLAAQANFIKDGVIPVQFDIAGKVKRAETMYLADGRFRLKVKKVSGKLITAEVLVGGVLTSRKGINLPDTDFGGDTFSSKDQADLEFGVEHGADYIGLSFVQRAQDIKNLRQRLHKLGSQAAIMSKLETKMAVKYLDEIIQVSDAVMVARGDLSQEVMPEQVPVIQQQIVALARKHQKPSVVATQMMLSMVHAPQPTCAEVSDVATAVMQAADAVMLSDETTIGDYPVEAVAMMRRIILFSQIAGPQESVYSATPEHNQPNAISKAAITLAIQTDAKAIIAETTSGQTARNVSSFRPLIPIIMVTHNQTVYQQLAIMWGGWSFCVSSPSVATHTVINQLKKAGAVQKGDTVVIASGHQPGLTGGTDTVRMQIVI